MQASAAVLLPHSQQKKFSQLTFLNVASGQFIKFEVPAKEADNLGP